MGPMFFRHHCLWYVPRYLETLTLTLVVRTRRRIIQLVRRTSHFFLSSPWRLKRSVPGAELQHNMREVPRLPIADGQRRLSIEH